MDQSKLNNLRKFTGGVIDEELFKLFGVETREDLEKAVSDLKANQARSRLSSMPGVNEDSHKGETYSLAKVTRGLILGGSVDAVERYAPMEYEAHIELTKRKYGTAQAISPDGDGGFLVPTEVRNDLMVDLYRPNVTALGMGVVEVDFDSPNVEIPVVASTVTPSEGVAEGQGTDTTKMGFAMAKMEPRTAQVYIEMTKRFLSAGTGAENIIRRHIATEMALTDDRWILKGLGGKEPIGIYTANGTTPVDFAGVMETSTTPDHPKFAFYEKLLEMEDALADNNALKGRLGWIIANKAYRAMRLIRGSNITVGSEVQTADIQRRLFSEAAEQFIIGYQMRRTTQLAQGTDTEMIFGDFSSVYFGTWGGLTLEASGVAGEALRERKVHLVAYRDVDVLVSQPTAFAVSNNLNLSGM